MCRNPYNECQQLQPIRCAQRNRGRYTQLLIDSGASLTLINLHFFNQLPKYYRERAQPPPPNLCLQLADRSQLYVKYAYFKRRLGAMRKQHLKEDTMMNEVNYILSAAGQVKIPPFHVSNIQVKPNKPFSKVDKRSEQDEYEVTSIKHTTRGKWNNNASHVYDITGGESNK